MMTYKGYTGRIVSTEKGVFHGEVIGLTDVITFRGKTAPQVERAFQESVDDYLQFCEERGESPETPYSGKFVVRISPALHCSAANAADRANQSLNAWVKSAIESALVTPVTQIAATAGIGPVGTAWVSSSPCVWTMNILEAWSEFDTQIVTGLRHERIPSLLPETGFWKEESALPSHSHQRLSFQSV